MTFAITSAVKDVYGLRETTYWAPDLWQVRADMRVFPKGKLRFNFLIQVSSLRLWMNMCIIAHRICNQLIIYGFIGAGSSLTRLWFCSCICVLYSVHPRMKIILCLHGKIFWRVCTWLSAVCIAPTTSDGEHLLKKYGKTFPLTVI